MKKKKIEGYLLNASDPAKTPSKATQPYLVAIRDKDGSLTFKSINPERVKSKTGNARWRNPSPQQLRKLRTSAGLTQAQAATLCLSAPRSWQDWEYGKRKMHPAIFQVFAAAVEALERGEPQAAD